MYLSSAPLRLFIRISYSGEKMTGKETAARWPQNGIRTAQRGRN
jgi:hypothetical protein